MSLVPFPSLYVICDADACERHGWSLTDFASACLDGGATLLQLRVKRGPSRTFLDDTERILQRAAGRATIIVNDRADIACLAGAHGVHVGQDDLRPDAVRTLVGPNALIGLSTHTREQLVAAVREPVQYVAIGPVYGTGSKDTGYEAVGIGSVRMAAQIAGEAGMPVVAIGGITLERAPDVIAAGATSVSVISDLFVGGDPAARTRAFLTRLARV